ncbi:ATP synthase subunit epsilon, mitochondrial isoform X2 [Hevea brasiliensis]|uniref:ATP synthase subunit epsilon, mitochondrial isoform X2 n=1 Tax=Hevea brasiliensis TaxID=3981 RepID=UPI0026011CFB|nr:ATP synthase subunit epsilon, mitochondrial isoform X2 [Hevea brasiliensis]
MASNAAVPFWRAAGMTYITYSNICANLVRNCLKEPYKTEALTREKVHFAVSKWVDSKPQKSSMIRIFLDLGFLRCAIRSDTEEE